MMRAKLCDRCPELAELRAKMAATTIYSDDIPEAYLRLLFGDDKLISSRVDALNRGNQP
jgi:hypothetical protein